MAINTEYQGVETGEKGPFHHAKAAVDEARAFKEALGSSVSNFSSSIDLRGRVQRHPIGMVCAALGVGYVLGGGLFSPFTSRLLKIGIRLAVIPLVKSQLSAMAGAAAQPGEGAGGSTF
ncbi:MAG: hypothetical protein E6J78_01500 [Deltaproteobacteria bacterium]|nr:MAG: hypothetical protein E6J78_01500 [Deltaproteobacteria bacterium]